MFSTKSSSSEIFENMELNLRKNAFEQDSVNDNLKKEAIELLNIAADRLERDNLIKHAEIITKIAEYVSIANADPAISKLASEKQVEHSAPLNITKKMRKPVYKKALIVVDDELDENELEEIRNMF